MNFKKTNLLSIFFIVLLCLSFFKTETVQAVQYKRCLDAGNTNGYCETADTVPLKGVGGQVCFSTPLYNTKEECEAKINPQSGAPLTDSIKKAQQAIQEAEQAAEAQQAAQDALKKQQDDAVKKAMAAAAAKAAELVCDCSKTDYHGQCRDGFLTVQDAIDYCGACGITEPQSSAVGCPLGSKETGPFSCTCGTGDKAICSVYDSFSELDKKCSPSCGRSNGSCTVAVGNSLKALQKSAAALNPAGFAFGSAGVTEIFGKIITFLMFPIGMFAMVLYIWAGFLWMTAQGNSENVSKSKSILIWTTIGIVVTLASYMLVQLVFTQIL